MTVSREHILREIQRTAEENGGTPLGRGRFAVATGIRSADCERYWARWSDAVSEAGLTPNQLNQRYTDDEVLQPLTLEVRRLGRMPTTQEMRLRRREGAALPSSNVYAKYGSKRELIATVAAYCRKRDDLADVAEILAPLLVEPEAREDVEDDVEEFGFIYLIKSGRHYKLGRTNSAGRRERELAIQLPEPATTVHTITTDDPVGIEAYWHKRFADRRIRPGAEFFALTTADVRAFKRRKSM